VTLFTTAKELPPVRASRDDRMTAPTTPPHAPARDTFPRRVGLLIESGGPGGAESVVLGLANGLRDRGIAVFPLVLADHETWLTSRLERDGHRVFRPTLRSPLDWQMVTNVRNWIVEHDIELLHAHEFTMGFYSAVAGALTRTPHVITMHGGVKFAAALRRRLALSIAARRAFATVGVSESTCDHLAHALFLPRGRIDLVRNGVPITAGDRERTRAALGLDGAARMILAVGNLYPVKGHADLVAAADLLQRRVTEHPWRIFIAGRGDQEATLRSAITKAGLTDRVELLGIRNDIPDLLSAADGWVMPSRSEGLPMALLEALYAGLPIVATAVGGIPAVLGETGDGVVVPPRDPGALADAIEALLRKDPSAAARASRKAAVASSPYSVDTMVSNYLDVYRRTPR
jgi:glycosyltransferase involved in cell wall biosynthesis